MKSWKAVSNADDIQASSKILPSGPGGMQLQPESRSAGDNHISMNGRRLSIYSNLVPHCHGDGGPSVYKTPPPPPRKTQDRQLFMQSFGDPTNGGPWNPPKTKSGSPKWEVGEAAAAAGDDATKNVSDGDGGGSKWTKRTL
ncbi:unnamed protein product [Sphagnum jensenii]|uniref:Uncharacterized protein n=1 Tax=Sphagnum jensenii TaxID=128206 RepID=A0ABP1AID4_9BRYO